MLKKIALQNKQDITQNNLKWVLRGPVKSLASTWEKLVFKHTGLGSHETVMLELAGLPVLATMPLLGLHAALAER